MDVLSYSGRPGDFHVFFIVFLGVRSASELMGWVVKRNKDTPLVSIVATLYYRLNSIRNTDIYLTEFEIWVSLLLIFKELILFPYDPIKLSMAFILYACLCK